MSVRRKFADLLQYFNPFSANLESPPPPPPQDEDIPARKRPRLEASTSISSSTANDADTGVDADATASPGDTVALAVAPTSTDAVTVTVPASLPNARAPLARMGYHNWKPEEDAKLTEAVAEHGDNNWAAVAKLVTGRTNNQCGTRWNRHLNPDIVHVLGKWTPEEDAKLTEVVKELGSNNWITVAALVPGRTNQQCRRRWVESLDHTTARKDKRNKRWTVEEDAKLTKVVTEHGNKWSEVATLIPGRTNNQCRQRWEKSLDPDINTDKWTAQEEARLVDAVQKRGKDWVAVAALVPGRNNTQCCRRWCKTLNPATTKGRWTLEEDQKLSQVIADHGTKWALVTAMIPGRTSDQCRQRWRNNLDPGLRTTQGASSAAACNYNNKGKWTAQEDAKLAQAVKEHGDNNWVAVAALVPGRRNDQCRHRWTVFLGPSMTTTTTTMTMTTPRNEGQWTAKEDATLTDAVKKHPHDWVRIAALLPGRTNTQCNYRWVTYCDPAAKDRTTGTHAARNNNKGTWTPEEDQKLTDAVAELGTTEWAQVTAMVPGRIDHQCRARWYSSLDPTIKQQPSTDISKVHKWTAEEDAKLIEAVTEHGNKWSQVAAMVPGRFRNQCRQRWARHLDPTIDHSAGRYL
jgi:hypothetical protein